MSRMCAGCSDEIAAAQPVSSHQGLMYHVGCLSLELGRELEARVAMLLKRSQEAVDQVEHGKHVRHELYAQRRKLRLLLAEIRAGRQRPGGGSEGPAACPPLD